LHNTYGMASANAWQGVKLGVRRFDASLGGIGGCPFAPGAAGNIATDDLIDMLHREGVGTGVDGARLARVRDRLAIPPRPPLSCPRTTPRRPHPPPHRHLKGPARKDEKDDRRALPCRRSPLSRQVHRDGASPRYSNTTHIRQKVLNAIYRALLDRSDRAKE